MKGEEEIIGEPQTVSLELNKIHQGNCLELMKLIPSNSIDMILCDLPYGTTACKRDTIIPFEPLWEQYKRVIKDNGAIVLTASQPFTSTLVVSNPSMFSCSRIREKEQGVNFMMSKKQPMKVHEDILVFSKRQPRYNPIMTQGKPYVSGKGNSGEVTGSVEKVQTVNEGTRYPRSIVKINRETGLHPTQKPVALFEYLIKTYTNEGDVVLDNCIGSGTTAIACLNTNRHFIGMELSQEYVDIANARIAKQVG